MCLLSAVHSVEIVNMVVPVPKKDIDVRLNEVKTYVGNNLNLKLFQNVGTIVIVGNNCKVKVSENYGAVKVTGNNCVIEIAHGLGSVLYTGNNGTICLGPGVDSSKVTYMGSNGEIVTKSPQSGEEAASRKTYTESCILPEEIKDILRNLSIKGKLKADAAYVIKDNVRIQSSGSKKFNLNKVIHFSI